VNALRTASIDEIRDVVVISPRRGLPELLYRALADTGALLRGHFGLYGGKHTEYFIRFRTLSRDRALLELVAEHLVAHVDPGVATVLVPESAGFFLGDAIARRLGATVAVARTDLQRRPGRTLFNGALHRGDQVLVVNDVVTTGTSLEPLLDLAADRGATVAGVLVFGALDGPGFRAVLNRRAVPGEHLLEAGPAWPLHEPERCPACARGIVPLLPAAELN
jgi:orotate phosphoribosyltransferase